MCVVRRRSVDDGLAAEELAASFRRGSGSCRRIRSRERELCRRRRPLCAGDEREGGGGHARGKAAGRV